MRNAEKIIKFKLDNILFEIKHSKYELSIKIQNADEIYNYVEHEGIFGLFNSDERCCESWRFQPTIEQICRTIFQIQFT